MTYLLLNIAVLIGVITWLVAVNGLREITRKPVVITLVITLVLTAIFDSVIIALGLVAYDTAKILGIYIGKAPIEDFAYTVVMVLIIPALWKRQSK